MLDQDDTTMFMKGAILGYCQSHEPEEVAKLFDDVFLTLDIDKAANISAAIAARYFYLITDVRDSKEVDEYLKKAGKLC